MNTEDALARAEELREELLEKNSVEVSDTTLIRDFYAYTICSLSQPDSWGCKATRQSISRVVANMVSSQMFLYNRHRLKADVLEIVQRHAYQDLPVELPSESL